MPFLFLMLLSLISSLLTASSAIPFLSGCEIYGGTLLLKHPRPKHDLLVATTLGPSVVSLFDAREFDFQTLASGYDFRLQKKFATFFANGRVFGRNDWSENADTFNSPNGLMAPATMPFPPTFLIEGSCSPTYASNLWNCEGNVGYYLGPTPFTFYAGYRFLFLNEHLNLHFEFDGLETNADLKTKNHLKGPQVGFAFSNLKLPFKGSLLSRLRISGFAASFKYDNKIHANYLFNSYNDTSSFSGDGEVEISGKGIDGGISLEICLLRRLSISIGYEALWIERVATATSQLPQTNIDLNSIQIQTQSLLFQGLQAGIKLIL